jgi:hypothetical protein
MMILAIDGGQGKRARAEKLLAQAAEDQAKEPIAR